MNVPTHAAVTKLDLAEALLVELSRLRLLADKVAHVHGATHPEMLTFAVTAGRIADTIAIHVTRLNAGIHDFPSGGPARLRMALAKLSALSHGFAPWPGACASVHLLLSGWIQAQAMLNEHLGDA